MCEVESDESGEWEVLGSGEWGVENGRRMSEEKQVEDEWVGEWVRGRVQLAK